MTVVHVHQDITVDDLRELLGTARSLRARATAETSADASPMKNVAERLQASVIRPLAMLVGDTEESSASAPVAIDVGTPDMVLWDLARRVTAFCAALGRPAALIEAAAALQELTCPLGTDEECLSPQSGSTAPLA